MAAHVGDEDDIERDLEGLRMGQTVEAVKWSGCMTADGDMWGWLKPSQLCDHLCEAGCECASSMTIACVRVVHSVWERL